jgi:hypothetical protein
VPKRETDAVAQILSDPENQSRSAEEVAELAIQALDDLRARTHRLAVVGQLQFTEAQETHTVILGPFSSRGVLDGPDKFAKATQGGTAAREAGQHLAWDTKTGTGHGRFMLVPAFRSPRDAWDFFRPDGHGEEVKRLTSKMLIEGGWREAQGAAALKADLESWVAGQWAEEAHPGPTCKCGVPEHPRFNSLGMLAEPSACPKHAA